MASRPPATRPRGRAAALTGALLALATVVGLVSTAFATPDTLSGGSTTLQVKGGGVSGKAGNPASKQGKNFNFPITGGQVDPTNMTGSETLGGSVKLKHGHHKTTLKNLTVDLNGATGSVSGKVGRKKVKLMLLSRGTLGRAGFGGTIVGALEKLTKPGANALNNALDTHLKKNRKIGNLSTSTIPAQTALATCASPTASCHTELIASLQSFGPISPTTGTFTAHGVGLGTGVTPVSPATVTATPSFWFPITGGSVTPTNPPTAGSIQGGGGLTITKNTATGSALCDGAWPRAGQASFSAEGNYIRFNGFSVDLQSKTVIATVTAESQNATAASPSFQNFPSPGVTLGTLGIGTLDLSGATTSVNPTTRTIQVNGAKVLVDSTSLLFDVFGVSTDNSPPGPCPAPGFAVGQSLGTVNIATSTQ